MTEIKICGLRREEDIDYVNELLPEYAGFVFCRSKRKVDPLSAKNLIERLDPSIKRVGVFLDQGISEVKDIADFCGLDLLQFHGSESPEYCDGFSQIVWKAFSIINESSFENIANYNVRGFLLDSFTKAQGGSGKKFNWDLLEGREIPGKFILAGGIHSGNVEEAILRISPDILDVSSGVETDGKKDYYKIKELIGKVRLCQSI